MIIKNFFVIGVMSGTSLDGIDLAYIHFTLSDDRYNYSILKAQTVSYSTAWVNKLKNAIQFSDSDLIALNKEYSLNLSTIISNFISVNKIEKLDFIGSHGHTIKHRPELGYTLQIGNLPEIKEHLLYPIVCDFRVQDVMLGGQGAPLVPIGDALLFGAYDYCLNLGGFSNVSFNIEGKRIAFDLSPVNTVLNFYSNKLELPFDNKGLIARSGILNIKLLDQLNNLDFYNKTYPKSLGLEFVQSTIIPLIEGYDISIENKLRTFTEHVAFQIVKGLPTVSGKLLITGGGAYNDFLIELIEKQANKLQIIIPDSLTIEFKEALIFGFLALLKYQNKINVLASVTGAKHDHSSGVIYK